MLAKEGEVTYPALDMPSTVERTSVTIWSNGVAMDGDIYRPKDLDPSRRAAAVVLSHGWGGSKATGERYAAKFAAAGMVSLCFTHCGWASSAGQVVLVGDRPDLDRNNEGVAKVRLIREVVDPVEWIQNFRAAVDYMEGEPGVDTDRIGAWGTSFGGASPCTARRTTTASRPSRSRSHRCCFAAGRSARAASNARSTLPGEGLPRVRRASTAMSFPDSPAHPIWPGSSNMTLSPKRQNCRFPR